MKKLLLILLCLLLLFITCKKDGDNTPSPQSMEDVIVGKKWWLSITKEGFLLSDDGRFYLITECQPNNLIGDWIIDGDQIKYRYYVNSQEITMLYGEVNSYSSTEIKLNYFSNPTTQINLVYTQLNEVYGCRDPSADNYNPLATCDDSSCTYSKTYVPDDNFEAYLEANGMGNGIANDDYVTTININTVTVLNSLSSLNISNLTGIEDFIALTYLRCGNNQLTTLDLSQNTALTTLSCLDNQLAFLNVSNNTALTNLFCENNQLTSLDVSGAPTLINLFCDNNQLTSLDVSGNMALTLLSCNINQLTTLDVSQNTALINLSCWDNQLTFLDVSNGNNTNMTYFGATTNPNLTCINVDDSLYSTANWTNIDLQHFFSEYCGN